MSKDEATTSAQARRGRIVSELEASEKPLSGTALAKELGVTQTHLSNIENGRAGLTIPNLIKLHQILECPISSFFVDIEGEKEADNSSDITLENVMELARLLKKARA